VWSERGLVTGALAVFGVVLRFVGFNLQQSLAFYVGGPLTTA